MEYKNFEELFASLKESTEKKTCVVADAGDEHTLDAVVKATKDGLMIPILVGNQDEIERILKELGEDPTGYEIIACESDEPSAQKACELVKAGRANCIMKGRLETSTIMHAVLKKENELRGDGPISSVSMLEIPGYHKLLLTTDPGGMIMYPDVDQKQQLIENAVKMLHGLGIENPKVAVLAAIEKVNPKQQATVDAAELKRRNQEGIITGCIVEGPLSYDITFSKDAAKAKHIESVVAGDPDLILYPNIDVGNICGKALVFTAGAKSAAIMIGAKVPIINTSRALSVEGKCRAIALAVACG